MAKKAAKLQMWGSRILLRSAGAVEDHTEGGLFLPQQSLERQRYRLWEVVAVGPQVLETALAPGLRVLVSGVWVGEAVRWGDEEFRVVEEGHVIAIL